MIGGCERAHQLLQMVLRSLVARRDLIGSETSVEMEKLGDFFDESLRIEHGG